MREVWGCLGSLCVSEPGACTTLLQDVVPQLYSAQTAHKYLSL